jgi:hypothetical protein
MRADVSFKLNILLALKGENNFRSHQTMLENVGKKGRHDNDNL